MSGVAEMSNVQRECMERSKHPANWEGDEREATGGATSMALRASEMDSVSFRSYLGLRGGTLGRGVVKGRTTRTWSDPVEGRGVSCLGKKWARNWLAKVISCTLGRTVP